MGWLERFVEHNRHGEAPAKMMYWVGVSTLAGALQRKVYMDQDLFHWNTNFYVLLVGPPGAVKKSTSAGAGTKLLRKAGIDLGPQSITWQRLLESMAEEYHADAIVDGQPFRHSSITLSISEFGNFFKPMDQDQVDMLTDLWDGKPESFRRETKTAGKADLENPWINLIGCTTPKWVTKNFPADMIETGFGSRPIYVYVEKPEKRVAYPKRQAPMTPERKEAEAQLVEDLRVMSEYAGIMELTEEGYEWGEKWYKEFEEEQDRLGPGLEHDFRVRLQTHLHKLAMVISCSDGDFPNVTEVHLQKADAVLRDLVKDAKQIFNFVGQNPITSASLEIEKILSSGPLRKGPLYKLFRSRFNIVEFELALKSAIASGSVVEMGNLADPLLELRK